MKLFSRLFATDMRHGLHSYLPLLGLVVAISIFECFVSYASIMANNLDVNSLGFADFAFALFAGMEQFEYVDVQQFSFPMAWLMLLCAIACSTLVYPVHDLDGMGSRFIAVTGNRWMWWLSKCLWTIAGVLGLCLISLGVCVAATCMTGGCFSFDPTPEINRLLNVYGVGSTSVNGSLLGFVLLLPCAISALLILQLTVSLLINPAAGFLTTTTLLLASAYYTSPLLLGNYLMAARLDIALANGLTPANGALLALSSILLCILVGGFVFARRDIMGRKGSFL